MPPRSRKTTKPAGPETVESKRVRAVALQKSINSRKDFGPGTVVLASEVLPSPPRITVGSLAFDAALGGGFPMNQWTEVVGNESSGKTTVVLKAIAARQRIDPEYTVAWVAAEGWDSTLADMCGVDGDGVFLIEENVMEKAFELSLEYIEARACDMLVIDSYPALVTELEDEKDVGETNMGGAKLLNRFMRKATKATKRSLIDPEDLPFCGVIINQWRERIGVMHGDPRTTSGGKGKNYWMYARLDVKRDEWIVNAGKEKVGQVIKIVVMKMKGARPQLVGVTDFYFADDGEMKAGDYDTFKAMLALAEYYELIPRRGSGFVGPTGEYYKGRESVMAAIAADIDWKADLETQVLRISANGVAPVAAPEDQVPEPDLVDTGEDQTAEVIDLPARRSPRSRRKSL